MSFWQAFRASWRMILTDHGLIPLFVLAIPFYSLFYPLPYDTEAVRGVSVIVVDQDSSPLSRQLIRELAAAPSVRLQGTLTNLEAARREMADGRVAGVVIVPYGFFRDVQRGTPTTVETWGTGAFPVQSKAVLEATGAVVQGIARQAATVRMVRQGASTAYARQGAAQPPAYIEQNLFNITRGYGSYVVAAVAILIVQQVILIGIATLVGTWYEARYAPLFAAGRLQANAFAGVWLALALAAFPGFLYMIGCVFWFQDYPRGGNLLAGIAYSGLMSLAVAAMGIFAGALLARRERALQALLVTSLPTLFVSGAMYPREAMPAFLQAIAATIPSTPGITAFLKLNQMGASWSEIRPEIWNMSLLVLLYGLAAWLMLAWRRRRLKNQG